MRKVNSVGRSSAAKAKLVSLVDKLEETTPSFEPLASAEQLIGANARKRTKQNMTFAAAMTARTTTLNWTTTNRILPTIHWTWR